MSNERILALIPARGGSKRLPGKNVLSMGGKPLIAWSIEAAKNSGIFADIVVSTDDGEIAEVSRKYGAQIPFMRPAEVAGDSAGTFDVVKHALEALEKLGKTYTHVMVLQPTSPLRSPEDITRSLELLKSKNSDAVISVTLCEHPPQWSNTLPENGSMDQFLKPELIVRSQDLPSSFRLNGAIYLYETQALLKNKAMLPMKNSFAYVMDQARSIDIDTQFDFDVAAAILSLNKKS